MNADFQQNYLYRSNPYRSSSYQTNPCRRVLSGLLCLWMVVFSLTSSMAQAQSVASDFEAPIIEHEVVEEGVLGDAESFVATVVDNIDVENVTLFFRFSGESEFSEIPMRPLAESSYYTVTVDTSTQPSGTSAIEYYLRAEDTAGNVVLKGFTFEPLVRNLAGPEGIAAAGTDANTSSGSITAEPQPTQPVSQAESTQRKGINWLWVGLGVLLVGGAAAAASGGDDDPVPAADGPPGNCGSNCTVTLTISPP